MNSSAPWNRLRHLTIPIWVRLGVPICLIVAALIGLIGFLNFYNYQKTYRQLNVSRILVVARDLRQTIEAGLNVGLAPRSNTQLKIALDLAKETTPGMQFAAIISEKTKENLVEVGDIDPVQDWRTKLSLVGDNPFWLGEDAASYQVGLPFRNNFSVVAGGVVVGYDKRAVDQAMIAMQAAMFFDWLRTSAVFAVLALFGVWCVTRRLDSELKLAEAALDKTFDAGPIAPLRTPLLGPDIENGIPAFIAQSRAAIAALCPALPDVAR